MKLASPLIGLLLSIAASATWANDSPGAVFDRYLAAVHAGDMAAVRALIAPDVERADFPGCRAEMDHPTCLAHDIEATVVAPKARLSERSRRVDGETIEAVVEVRSALYTRAGVERIVGRDVLRVRDGRIRSFRFVPDFADEPTAVFFATLGIGPRAPRGAAASSKP